MLVGKGAAVAKASLMSEVYRIGEESDTIPKFAIAGRAGGIGGR
jgi:hypothetical protein